MKTRTGLLHLIYLSALSKPAHERVLYRRIAGQRFARIVELGVGDGRRARRMIAAARRGRQPATVHYTGIDLFESRSSSRPGMTLKRAHRYLNETGVRLRLLPGDPYSALARHANALTDTDLVVIAADLDPVSLGRCWFYLPRMLHAQSLVFCETLTARGPRMMQVGSEDVRLRARSA